MAGPAAGQLAVQSTRPAAAVWGDGLEASQQPLQGWPSTCHPGRSSLQPAVTSACPCAFRCTRDAGARAMPRARTAAGASRRRCRRDTAQRKKRRRREGRERQHTAAAVATACIPHVGIVAVASAAGIGARGGRKAGEHRRRLVRRARHGPGLCRRAPVVVARRPAARRRAGAAAKPRRHKWRRAAACD
eukprot:258763-Chlamydomonas_euryale.AAC.10